MSLTVETFIISPIMAYYSSTKSWQISNDNQRRECKAHAVFNRLVNFPEEVSWYVGQAKEDLLRQIRRLKEKNPAGLSKEDLALIELEKEITEITDISKLEGIFSKVEKYVLSKNIGLLKSADVKAFMKNGELSKIVKAKEKFSWTGSGSRAPNGITESALGMSEDFLNKLMAKCNAAPKLDSWLQASDENWWRAIQPYITSRKKELAQLEDTSPKNDQINNRIGVLKMEIKKLEQDWKL